MKSPSACRGGRRDRAEPTLRWARSGGAPTHPGRLGGRTPDGRRASGHEGGGRMSERGLRLVSADGPADVEALIGRVARGDAKAFEALYDELSPAVFGLARRVVRDPARAEDVT